ncbi:MAG: Rv3235 family protein [Actinomycetes bacterium]
MPTSPTTTSTQALPNDPNPQPHQTAPPITTSTTRALLRPVPVVSRRIPQPASRAVDSARGVPALGVIQGTLALQWSRTGDDSAAPGPAPDLRLVPRVPAMDRDTDPAVAVVATSRDELPDPGRWTAQLVQAVVEVLAHERPRQQLVRWLTPDVYADLSAHVMGSTPPSARAQNPSGTRARRNVSSIHVFEPADGIVEANAVVVGGRRARAVALRLEGWDGRWRCTHLAVL